MCERCSSGFIEELENQNEEDDGGGGGGGGDNMEVRVNFSVIKILRRKST